MLFFLNVFGVGVSCRILYSFVVYLYVSGNGSITSVGEERELLCLLLFTCNFVISVILILVLRTGFCSDCISF